MAYTYDDVKLVDNQILVGYGYDLDESPEWYKVAWKNSIFGQVKSFKKNIVVIKVTTMVGIMKTGMKKVAISVTMVGMMKMNHHSGGDRVQGLAGVHS